MKLLRRVCIDVSVHAVIEEEVLMWVVIKHDIYIFSMWLAVSVCVCVRERSFHKLFLTSSVEYCELGRGCIKRYLCLSACCLGRKWMWCLFLYIRQMLQRCTAVIGFIRHLPNSVQWKAQTGISELWLGLDLFFYTFLPQIEMYRLDKLRKTFLSN